jgi:hypothetical protein
LQMHESWLAWYNSRYYQVTFTQMKDTLTGSWVALAGVIVSVLAHFNVVVDQDSIVAIIAGILAVYGLIHQFTVSKLATGSLK